VLVIDDGSTDDSVARLARFADPRLEVRIQSNVGLSTTLNRGLARARSRWVKFLPSDDALRPDCIARQLEAAAAAPDARLVFALPEVVDAGGKPLADPAPQAWFDSEATARDQILRGLVERNFLCAPAALFDRELALAVGGFDPALRIAQDYDLWLKLLALAPATFVHERLVRVRWHGANQSAAVTPASEGERARAVVGALERMGLERWIELFRAAPGLDSPERARAALAQALRRSGLREVEPFVERLASAPPRGRAPVRRGPGAILRGWLAHVVSVPRVEAAPIGPGPRGEHWLVLAPAPASAPGTGRSGQLAAALARGRAAVTLAAPPGEVEAGSLTGVQVVPAELAVLRALLRDRDDRVRLVVQQPDPQAIAFAREARLGGARILYDRAEGPGAFSRAAIDSERALVDAADDLIGGTRPTAKQLATSKRLVHLLPDATDAAGWDERTRALRGIAARPTIAVIVACLPWHDAATIAAGLDTLADARGELAYRIVAVDDGVSADALAELEQREEEGSLTLLRNALRGRGSGFNLALRAIAAELFVLLDAARRAPGPGWLDGPIRALLDARALGAVIERGAGAALGSGWTWVAPRPALARVAGFDEAYDPASLEDLDLEQQLRAIGYDVAPWYAAGAEAPFAGPAWRADAAAMRRAERRFRRRWRCSPSSLAARGRTPQV
jgi:hypothetical protein